MFMVFMKCEISFGLEMSSKVCLMVKKIVVMILIQKNVLVFWFRVCFKDGIFL